MARSLAVLAVSALIVVAANAQDWGYDFGMGPDDWAKSFPECGGTKQSPINIVQGASYVRRGGKSTIGSVAFYPRKQMSWLIEQSKAGPKWSCVKAGRCGYIMVDGTKYKLVQFHAHAVSENTMNGVNYPMEFHFVHVSAEGGLAVVGVFVDIGTSSTPGLKNMLKAFRIKADGKKLKFNVHQLIDVDSGYYTWSGSLTTPPCSEGVNWHLQKTVKTLNQESRDNYYNHIGGFPGNYRPVMPLNGRKVMNYSA